MYAGRRWPPSSGTRRCCCQCSRRSSSRPRSTALVCSSRWAAGACHVTAAVCDSTAQLGVSARTCCVNAVSARQAAPCCCCCWWWWWWWWWRRDERRLSVPAAVAATCPAAHCSHTHTHTHHRRRQGLKSGMAQLKERGPGRRPDGRMRDEPQT